MSLRHSQTNTQYDQRYHHLDSLVAYKEKDLPGLSDNIKKPYRQTDIGMNIVITKNIDNITILDIQ